MMKIYPKSNLMLRNWYCKSSQYQSLNYIFIEFTAPEVSNGWHVHGRLGQDLGKINHVNLKLD